MVFAIVGMLLGLPLTVSAQSRSFIAPRVVDRLDEAQRTTLTGNTPPAAQRQFDQGALPDDTPAPHILLVLKRSDAQESELRQLIEDQQNPTSANFHQWMTPEEFASRFAPADSDIAQVTAWLQSKGFNVNRLSRGKQVIDFSGTAGQLRLAFQTQLHTYNREGVVFHANSSDPQIPAALAPVVAGFASLNDIQPQSYTTLSGTALMNPKTHEALPQWNDAEPCSSFVNGVFVTSACTYYPPTPSDLAVQYNVNPVYQAGTTGKGVTIGVASASNVDLGVVQTYRTLFGFTNPNNLPQVIIDGIDPGQTSASLEAYLDVEAASAMAPDATVDLYTSDDTLTTSGIVSAIVRAVDDDAADILSVSYGQCEQSLGSSGNQFFYQAWEQAAAQGQSVFVSAGDGGSAGCDNFNSASSATLGLAVNGFASTPFNTAVGGTDFYYTQWKEGRTGADLISQLQASWGSSPTTTNPATTLQAPIQEQVWNVGYGLDIRNGSFGHTIEGGSGGASSCVTGTGTNFSTGAYLACTGGYAKPSWQVGTGVPKDGLRDLPDVSLFASAGTNLSFWPICAGIYDCRADTTTPPYSISVTGVGGTSAAAPAMAGIMALVNQTMKGRQGNPNFNLYALAAQYPSAFHDVTVGGNNVPCKQGTPNCSLDTNGDGLYTLQNYSAGVGYDQASGLGSVNVANLVANWNKIVFKGTTTTLSLGSTNVVHGAPVTVNANVTSASGVPTGSIALVSTSTAPGQTGVGTINLTNGIGNAAISSLPGGQYAITGTYSGDGVYAASKSAPASITVAPEVSTATLVATDYNNNVNPVVVTTLTSGASVPYDDPLVLDVTVAGKSGQGTATGLVTFLDAGTSIGTATISSSGVAELITSLPPGAHAISAAYAGDPSFNASTTSALPITVKQGIPLVSLAYSENFLNNNSVIYTGQPFVVTVTVYGGDSTVAATGTVTVNFANLPPQTVKLTPSYAGLYTGIAYATFVPTVPGSYPVTVSYSGDSNFAAGTKQSPTPVVVVAPTLAPSTTTMTTSTVTVGPDGVFRLSASVTGNVPGKIPTGSVVFLFSRLSASVNLDSNGNATALLAGEDLVNGPNIVFAQYQGDTVYAVSSSAQTVITASVGDFSLTTSDPNIPVTSGASGTTTLYVAQEATGVVSGLLGAVNLTCTPASPAITCSLGSSSVNLLPNGAAASTTVTINSHVAKAGMELPETPDRRSQLIGGGATLAILLLWLPSRRKRLPSILVALFAASLLFGAAGCGSGAPATIIQNTGNAAPGQYLVTVLGSINGVQHSLVLTATVQ